MIRAFLLVTLLSLAGCSSFSLKDNLSDAAGVAVGVGVTTLAGPAAGVAAGTATSVAVNTVTQPEDNLADVPEEQRAEVLKHKAVWMSIEKLGLWALLIFAVFWFVPSPMEWIKDLRRR